MNKLAFRLVYTFIGCVVIATVLLLIEPYKLVNIEQAERIAKWKTEYQKLNYNFNLVKLHEESVTLNNGEVCDSECMMARIKPYFNIQEIYNDELSNYKYRKLNGRKVTKKERFYFDKFMKDKYGNIISVKKNDSELSNEQEPEYFMFIDLNGKAKPNRIGADIFIVNIFKDRISPLGSDKKNSKVKLSCSPIGNGVYCSEYYLLNGPI